LQSHTISKQKSYTEPCLFQNTHNFHVLNAGQNPRPIILLLDKQNLVDGIANELLSLADKLIFRLVKKLIAKSLDSSFQEILKKNFLVGHFSGNFSPKKRNEPEFHPFFLKKIRENITHKIQK
jgi:hypothetical protein